MNLNYLYRILEGFLEFLGSIGKVGFDTFTDRLYPTLHHHIFTLESNLFAVHLLHYFFYLDSNCQKSVGGEGVVCIAVDKTAFANIGLP